MKNFIFSAAVILTLSFSATAATTDPVNNSVLSTFNQLFKGADHVSWNNSGKRYEAFFTKDAVKTRALFNTNGNLIQTIRYYNESALPSNVLYRVKKEFSGKEIFGITEVANENGVNYRIVLRDNKNYIHINANSNGETAFVAKYKRGDK